MIFSSSQNLLSILVRIFELRLSRSKLGNDELLKYEILLLETSRICRLLSCVELMEFMLL